MTVALCVSGRADREASPHEVLSDRGAGARHASCAAVAAEAVANAGADAVANAANFDAVAAAKSTLAAKL